MTLKFFRRGRIAWMLVLASAVAISPRAFAGDKSNSAADVVPADCAFFSTSLRLKEQFDSFLGSNAVKKARNSQLGKMVEMQLMSNLQKGDGKQFMEFLESPQGKDLCKVLHSMFKDEMFFYGDGSWADLIKFANEMNFAQYSNAAEAIGKGRKPEDSPKAIINLIVKRNPNIPTMVMGFKFSEFETLNKYIEELVKLKAQCPIPIKEETVKTAGGDIRTFTISGSAIPKDKFMKDFHGEEELGAQLYDYLSKKTLTIGLGKWKDYLVLSFGPDAKSVERLGTGTAIVDHADFAPAQKHLSGKVLGLGYVSANFLTAAQGSAEGAVESITKMVDDMKSQMPDGLADRIKSDIKSLAPKIEKSMSKPSAIVAVSLENRGVESYSYTKSGSPMFDYSKALSILQRAGKDPMLAAAMNQPSSKEDYDTMVEVFKLLYGYWTDYGMKMLPPDQAEMAKKVEGPVLTFLKKLDNINRTKLIPATDAGQSLFVVDTKGKFEGIPFVFQIEKSLPMLELAMAFTANDGKLFEQGMSEVLNATDELIVSLANVIPDAPDQMKTFKIPRPVAFPNGNNGTMYTYPILGTVGGLMPNAIVSDKLIVLSTSQTIGQRISAGGTGPENDVVKLNEPSASAAVFRLDGFNAAVKEWIAHFEKDPKGPFSHMPEQARPLVKEGIDLTFELLGTFKGMATRSYKDGDYYIQHSWLHFEDLKN